jgi:hypothetical protein
MGDFLLLGQPQQFPDPLLKRSWLGHLRESGTDCQPREQDLESVQFKTVGTGLESSLFGPFPRSRCARTDRIGLRQLFVLKKHRVQRPWQLPFHRVGQETQEELFLLRLLLVRVDAASPYGPIPIRQRTVRSTCNTVL